MPIVHNSQNINEQLSIDIQTPILQAKDLHFNYPDGHTALRGLSLKIYPGEKVALVGPNGSGKSTFMLHINGLLSGKGQISICDLPVVEENYPTIRARVGLVFQNPDDQLFSPTVYEDVAFGPLHMGLSEEEVKHRVQEALGQVSMREYAKRLSYHLSTGEKKRIAIATVLSMYPDLLILDEPTAGLDPRARRQLINLLDQLPLSMLVATHDLLMVRELFPRMVILDNGEVVADGPTAKLLRDIPLLEAHGLEMP
jgi:cobalt transport protein ATP-binding subunit